MSRRRIHGEDLAYAEWHRLMLPVLYQRIGHRLDMADRDWTEFCHHCRQPIALYEEVMDRGQNLYEKATTFTVNLARRAALPAFLIAPKVVRPRDVQDEIEELQRRVIQLQTQDPIESITSRLIHPYATQNRVYSPDEWAAEIVRLHQQHYEAKHPFLSKEFLVREGVSLVPPLAARIFDH